MVQGLHPLLHEHTTAHIMGLFPFLISLLSKSHMCSVRASMTAVPKLFI